MQNLLNSYEELEQFVYIASHDLQEPLRMIASYTDLLAQRYREHLDDRADKYIQYVVNGAKRMHYLLNDLLAYARVSSQEKVFQPVDMNQVIEAAVSNLHLKIEENQAKITWESLPIVAGNRSQLIQLTQNLIDNALKFRSVEPLSIRISVCYQNGNRCFSIADNGIGIAPEFHHKIFVIFRRLHPQDTYPGSGIGLAIAKKIVQQHKGRIWLESEPGKGTTFYFTLQERGAIERDPIS